MNELTRTIDDWVPRLVFILVGYLLALLVLAVVDEVRRAAAQEAVTASGDWPLASRGTTGYLPNLAPDQRQLTTWLALAILGVFLLLSLVVAVRLGRGPGPEPPAVVPTVAVKPANPTAGGAVTVVPGSTAPLTPAITVGPTVAGPTPPPLGLASPTVPPTPISRPAPTAGTLERLPGRAVAYSGRNDVTYGQGIGALAVWMIADRVPAYTLTYDLPATAAGYGGFIYRFDELQDFTTISAIELTLQFSDERAACELFLRDDRFIESRVALTPATASQAGLTVQGTGLQKTIRLSTTTAFPLPNLRAIRGLGCHSQTGLTRGRHQLVISDIRLITA